MSDYWIIRHKPTGSVLPNRGLTSRWEPVVRHSLPPRLFATKKGAENCASAWVQGIWSKVVVRERESWEYEPYVYEDTPTPTPVQGRSKDDLEVVRVTLEVANG